MPEYTETTPLCRAQPSVKVSMEGAGSCILKQNITSSTPMPIRSPTAFHTDIDEAGNPTSPQDRAFLSTDEEMDRSQLRRCRASTNWHHAGNRTSTDDESFASSSLSSSSKWKSTGKTSFGDRLKEKLAKKWEARNQRISLFDAWQRKLPTISKEVRD